jgi:hypothetical protein
MKSILLKKGILKINGADITTQELIKVALDEKPEGGFKYKDYKERARVENSMDNICTIDNGEGELLSHFDLEDKDFENLTKWVNSAGWGIRDPFVLDFLEQFHK